MLGVNIATMKFIVALLLALIALPVGATNLTVKCTPATKNTDGSAFATGSTPGFNLYGAYTGSPLVLLNPTPSPTCLFVRSNVNPGSIVYAVTQLESLNSVWGPESAQTAPITTVVPPTAPTPGSPSVSLASTSTIVYAMVNGENTFSALIVGSAPLATSCDATHAVEAAGVGYYVIPWTAVTFSGKLKSHTVYANCQ
jgi:hypothetical protein